MKKPQIYPQSFIARRIDRGQFKGFYSLGIVPEETAKQAKALPLLLDALNRIYQAHESKNNGAYMGEAVLCRAFADQAKAALLAAGYAE